MSAAVSQVILHPTLTQSIRVLSTTVGREKAYRAVQYFARILAWFFLNRGFQLEASRWNALKSAMATCRKILRLGKPLEHLQAALKATQLQAPTAEQFTSVARQLGYAGYLTYDALLWAASIKFVRLDPAKTQQLSRNSFRFWATGIVFSLAHSLIKTGRLQSELKTLENSRGEKETIGSEAERTAKIQVIRSQRQAARSQMLLDVLDIWIPVSGLGLVNLNDGIVGFCGFITSVLALQSQWVTINSKK